MELLFHTWLCTGPSSILGCEVGMDRNHGCIERHEFIDIYPIFLATNLDEKVKNIDYLKIKNFNLVSHVPFIR